MSDSMPWLKSWRADPVARALADRHYNRQKVGAPQFVPPGRCLVLVSQERDALWITSWPYAEYVRHAWAGAWVCSAFRNEGGLLSSNLIRHAVAATRAEMGAPPQAGMVTFVDASRTARRRGRRNPPGHCFREAGFRPAECSVHMGVDASCPACRAETAGGLVALQMLPEAMPAPAPAMQWQPDLWSEAGAA